ncbi:PREDICTED: inactive hydroxysteroid dehydrogenase-like protein 1 [Nanorana parkeri]|uniref:inactive hydroxysteroid dehydrogenase-like protein 1 n=1 Tax=Nanorana parkeri TaxID=125878 RepID=UPI000854A81B|nr:PREDICTED: inactive hydroxysteroid dehydrogenase-like protein 1 [Nanorana parkeri]
MELVNGVYSIPVLISKGMFHMFSTHLEILAAVGVFIIMWNIFRLLHFWYTMVQQYVTPCLLSRTKHIRQYGEWAIITGATDGIGKAYAEELASHGMNIILVSRNPEKLNKVSEAIAATYGVKTRFIVADFNLGHKVYSHIKEALKNVDVGILINNVGVFYDYPQLTADVSEDKLWEIINVNIGASVMMVKIVLPGMVQRKRGAIVNVSSATCVKPIPLINIYASSKSFMDHFTRGLHYEYSSKGIFIQSLVTFFVKTNITAFSTFLKTKPLLVADAKDYARQAVRTIGISRRTAGHLSHSIQEEGVICLCMFSIKQFINCASEYVVYGILCPCGKLYVGRTSRTLRVRFGEHKRNILNKVNNHSILRHFLEVHVSNPEGLKVFGIELISSTNNDGHQEPKNEKEKRELDGCVGEANGVEERQKREKDTIKMHFLNTLEKCKVESKGDDGHGNEREIDITLSDHNEDTEMDRLALKCLQELWDAEIESYSSPYQPFERERSLSDWSLVHLANAHYAQ